VAATSHTLDRFSFETLELMRNQFEGWQSQYAQDGKLKFYDVRINFTNFKDLNERRFYLNLPTSFFLASTDVDKLIDAGRRLLRQNPAYRKFLADMGAPVPPMPEPLPTQPEK
jgi:NTE family protein